MVYFKSSEELQKVLGGFFQLLGQHPQLGPKFLHSKLVVRFNYREPELSITADCTGSNVIITFNDTTKKPEVEMDMKADVAHEFWIGKINLLVALGRRQMIARGHIPKILKLLPILKPAHELYRQYIESFSL
ncbi:MAG: hypothetical protein COV45_08895 [Deltaproteobacteria bacterium CG11_big_fil_rev_8_21_14_0_20_47_16]|nr:MAG: hypothetical protein COV45_08895 [Deltaproteobacteria bacterium CG11_big_fil_rev_8_21_14_0_20_47_16]